MFNIVHGCVKASETRFISFVVYSAFMIDDISSAYEHKKSSLNDYACNNSDNKSRLLDANRGIRAQITQIMHQITKLQTKQRKSLLFMMK